MAHSLKFELDNNVKKLKYYNEKNIQNPNPVSEKWVAIYKERVKKIERKLSKLEK